MALKLLAIIAALEMANPFMVLANDESQYEIHRDTALESFLYAEYETEEKDDIEWAEDSILYYRRLFSLDDSSHIDYILDYTVRLDVNEEKYHVVSHLDAITMKGYAVILREGSNKAYVLNAHEFDETLFKQRVQKIIEKYGLNVPPIEGPETIQI
tara:strand:- start:165 stop:632 length:468 start_codon:yes stop_codon:yes gene_type:complete